MRTIGVLACLLTAACGSVNDSAVESPAIPVDRPVLFFGQKLSGETFVFMIDCSASMSWQGELHEVKGEIRSALATLGPQQSFSIVGWPGRSFSRLPLAATESNKILAFEWLGELQALGANRVTDELDQVLEMLGQESGGRRLLVLVSDVGVPGPKDWLAPLARLEEKFAENFDLHTFVISPRESSSFQALANATGGRYIRLR